MDDQDVAGRVQHHRHMAHRRFKGLHMTEQLSRFESSLSQLPQVNRLQADLATLCQENSGHHRFFCGGCPGEKKGLFD